MADIRDLQPAIGADLVLSRAFPDEVARRSDGSCGELARDEEGSPRVGPGFLFRWVEASNYGRVSVNFC
ncbi:MAG: hypothetical protein AAF514_05375 [Verrucomicrobiota bacterium]